MTLTLYQDIVAIRRQLTLLDKLEGADGVAAFLTSKGVTGFINNTLACPLARYLATCIPRPVSVGHYSVHVCAPVAPRIHVTDCANVSLPRTVLAFVQAFDQQQYPALIHYPPEQEMPL